MSTNYGPGPDAVMHDPGAYKPAPTGLVLTGDVAAAFQEVQTLRGQLVDVTADLADVEADNTRLRAALDASRLPHAVGCLRVTNPAYPCSCWAGPHNARIDQALGESPAPASQPDYTALRAVLTELLEAWEALSETVIYDRGQPSVELPGLPAERAAWQARIDAALGESPDALSESQESPNAANGH